MADIKNFGLKGVGSDLQYGKGGGHVSWTGTSFQFSTDGTTLTSIKGAPASTADQFVTLAQLDAVGSTGLSVKSEARVVVPDGVSLGTWTSANSGTYTGTPNVVDGVTLTVGDTVLVRYVGVTFGTTISTTADATRNGLYTVVSLDTGFDDGVWERADDSDTNAEVNYNNYVFVSEGTEGGNSFVLSNATGLDADLTLNTDPIIWVKFNEAKTYTASNGVKKVGGDFSLSIDSLASTASVNLTDTIALGDGNASGNDTRITVANFLNDAQVPHGISGTGLVNATGGDNYTTTTLSAYGDGTGYSGATPVDNGGLKVDTSSATAYKFGLDYENLPDASVGASIGYIGTSNAIALKNPDGTHFRANLEQVMNGLGAVRLDRSDAISATAGFIVKTSAETYAIQQLSASTTNAGIGITGGGYTLGVDILGTALPTGGVATLADQILVYSAADTVNRAVTLQHVLDLISANQPHNEIIDGNTSIIINDDNVSPGSIDFTVDGIAKGTFSNSGFTASSLSGSDLQTGRIAVVGAGGKLLTDNELLFDVDTNALTLLGAGTFNSITTTTGGITSGAGVTASGDIVSTGGNITSSNVITGNTVIGTNGIATGATSGISVGTGGVTSADLTVNKGIVFANSSKLSQDGTFLYDPVTHTLSVNNITVSGTANVGGIGAVAEAEVTFGATGGGSLASSSNFKYTAATSQLQVAGITVDGATQSITGSVTDGDIHIVPNGAGEVVIGAAGAGVLTSDAGNSMDVHGSTDLTLSSGTGSVFIKDGSNTVAQFNAAGTSDTHVVFSGGTAAGGVLIGTSQAADIKFVLGSTSLVRVSNAANYETALGTAGNALVNPSALVTKGYTDKLVSASVEEVIKSAVAVVDLASVGTTNIGSVLPANATVIRTRVNVITSTADAVTVEVGYAGQTSVYMTDAENDPASQGVYISDSYVRSNSNVQIIATVAGTPTASSGLVEVMVEYRVPSVSAGI